MLRSPIVSLNRNPPSSEPSQTLDDFAQRRSQFSADRSELVGDAWRNGRLHKAPDQAVPDEGLQRLGQHLLADALDPVAQQMEAQGPFAKRYQKQEAQRLAMWLKTARPGHSTVKAMASSAGLFG